MVLENHLMERDDKTQEERWAVRDSHFHVSPSPEIEEKRLLEKGTPF